MMHLKRIKGRGKRDSTTGQWQAEIKMYNSGCSYSTNSDVDGDAKLAAISDDCFLSCLLSAIATQQSKLQRQMERFPNLFASN